MFLSRWRKSNNQQLTGLDISPDFIKLLKINPAETPYQVDNFAIEPVPQGIIVKNEIKDTAFLGNLLRSMFNDAEISFNNVALAIPRSSVIIKNIIIDSRLTPDEIESRAWIEANRHFPELVGNIYLDFTILGPAPQSTSQLELMLIACRKEQIDPYFEVLKLASLNAKIVDVNSYALERALEVVTQQYPQTETIALLNLDFQLSTLIVIHEHKLIYAHDQTFDGHRLINQIKAAAEKKKPDVAATVTNPSTVETVTNPIVTPNGNPSVTTSNTVSETDTTTTENEPIISLDTIVPATPLPQEIKPQLPFFDVLKENLSSHLRHTMHFFYSSRPHISIQKIVIGGDCAFTTNLAQFVQQEIGVETVVADPFVSMSFNPRVDREKIKQYAPALMLSCGLALSKI